MDGEIQELIDLWADKMKAKIVDDTIKEVLENRTTHKARIQCTCGTYYLSVVFLEDNFLDDMYTGTNEVALNHCPECDTGYIKTLVTANMTSDKTRTIRGDKKTLYEAGEDWIPDSVGGGKIYGNVCPLLAHEWVCSGCGEIRWPDIKDSSDVDITVHKHRWEECFHNGCNGYVCIGCEEHEIDSDSGMYTDNKSDDTDIDYLCECSCHRLCKCSCGDPPIESNSHKCYFVDCYKHDDCGGKVCSCGTHTDHNIKDIKKPPVYHLHEFEKCKKKCRGWICKDSTCGKHLNSHNWDSSYGKNPNIKEWVRCKCGCDTLIR